MEKQEFEVMYGEEIDVLTWRIIDRFYMDPTYDSFFPDKASVVEHFRKFGAVGFDTEFFDDITAARKALENVLARERKNLGRYSISKQDLFDMVVRQVIA